MLRALRQWYYRHHALLFYFGIPCPWWLLFEYFNAMIMRFWTFLFFRNRQDYIDNKIADGIQMSHLIICLMVIQFANLYPNRRSQNREVNRRLNKYHPISLQSMRLLLYEATFFVICGGKTLSTLQWRHKGRDGVSNHPDHDCLLSRFFRHRSKKTKLRVTGLCENVSFCRCVLEKFHFILH